MTRLNWDAIGERFYETGVDRGVLYLPAQPGIAWTGLFSVAETPSGGEAKPYYIDGQKYLNVSTTEEYKATVNAYSYPKEFASCDGNQTIQNGLFITGQPRKTFGFSYRTMIGNDLSGAPNAYKIHLVYNALAGPAQRSNNTLSDSVSPIVFNWPITTKPPAITGYKPTAYLVVDSRYTLPDKLADIEDLLYGTEEDDALLPTPAELIAIFEA